MKAKTMHGCSFDRLFLFTMDIVYGHLTYFSQKILFIFFFFFFFAATLFLSICFDSFPFCFVNFCCCALGCELGVTDDLWKQANILRAVVCLFVFSAIDIMQLTWRGLPFCFVFFRTKCCVHCHPGVEQVACPDPTHLSFMCEAL